MNLLKQILSTQSCSYQTDNMANTIIDILDNLQLGYTRDKMGNIYCTKGDADLYPTMVCHIDTVHDINENVIVKQQGDNLYAFDTEQMQQYGIGGDDKVGIYITIMCLQHFKNFKAVFFVDEEVGCLGSIAADHTFFNDSTIVLQCDRQNITDFVNQISNTILFDDTLLNDIQPILTKYNRKVTTGGLTDVKQIALNNNVQVANMSCGYYNPHTDYEYINLTDVYNTMHMCIEIFKATKHMRYTINGTRTKPFTFQPTYHNYNYGYYNYYDKPKSYRKPYTYEAEQYTIQRAKDLDLCPFCNELTEYDIHADDYYCYNCQMYQENVNPITSQS